MAKKAKKTTKHGTPAEKRRVTKNVKAIAKAMGDGWTYEVRRNEYYGWYEGEAHSPGDTLTISGPWGVDPDEPRYICEAPIGRGGVITGEAATPREAYNDAAERLHEYLRSIRPTMRDLGWMFLGTV